jgi:hypothetical protein
VVNDRRRRAVFSLGHSTVVFLLALLIAIGAKIVGSLVSEDSNVHQVLEGLVRVGGADVLCPLDPVSSVVAVPYRRRSVAQQRCMLKQPSTNSANLRRSKQ